MSDLSENILRLRKLGKSYGQISTELGCSKSVISYHCGKDQKQKSSNRRSRNRVNMVLAQKVYRFKSERLIKEMVDSTKSTSVRLNTKVLNFHKDRYRSRMKPEFTFQDIIDLHGEKASCYLTGDPLDLADPSSFELDHIHPRSKGGGNTLDNLGLTTRESNRAKHNMDLEDFLDLCEKVLRHHGRI